MFSKLFQLVFGVACLVLGIQSGDYFWAFCGLIVFITAAISTYQLATGKTLPWNSAKEPKVADKCPNND